VRDGVQLGLLGTAATNRPIISAPGNCDGEIGGMIDRGNRSIWRKPASNFFNASKKNSFGCAANRKIGKAKDLSAPLHIFTASKADFVGLNSKMIVMNNLERQWL
jgi:hypothetical protein